MRRVHLKPVDQFYFRGHNDLTPGSNYAASTNYMPRPGTIYGALRAAYIHKYQDFTSFGKGNIVENVKRWMGSPRKIGEFRMKGLFLAHGDEPLFSVPLDLQVLEDDHQNYGYPLLLKKNEGLSSNRLLYQLYAVYDGKSGSSAGNYVALEDFKKLLLGEVTKVPLISTGTFLESSSKLGIALDYRTRISMNSMLYNIQEYSFKNCKDKKSNDIKNRCNQDNREDLGFNFMTVVEGQKELSFSDIPFARVGGGNNPFTLREEEGFTILNENEEEKLIKIIKETGYAKIVLLTPAIWKNGTKPESVEGDNKLIIENLAPLEIITVAIGRPVIVGGWDIQKGRPKPRMNAVPAGTTLYVKVKKDDAESFVKTFNLGNLSDKYTYEGYGLTIPAAVTNIKGEE